MEKRISAMSGFMVMAPFQRGVLASFEAETGIAVSVDWAPTTALAERIGRGARAEVLVVTAEAMEKFVADGIVSPGARVDFVEMTVGLAVRRGAPHPDISTLDTFRRTLLEARSIAYSRAGASGIYFRRMIEETGMADALASRLVVIESGLTGEAVVDGRAEIAIQQLSELGGVEGVEIVGGFPPEVASVSTVAAGVFTDAADAEAALRFVRFLQSEKAQAIFETNWLRPIRSGREAVL